MKSPRLATPARLLWTLVFLGALILVVNGTVFYALWQARSHLDDELGRRFEGTAHTAALLIQTEQVDLLLPEPEDTLGTDLGERMDRADAENQVRAEWVKLADGAGVSNILLLDGSQRLVFSIRDAVDRGSKRVTLDDRALAQALIGFPAHSRLYSVDGEYLKSGYAPVTRFNGSVAGAVVVEGGSMAFQPLDQISGSLIGAAVLASLLALVVGLGFLRTIGRLSRAEERMRHTDILASVGQLAAGVAHEIRNPLTVLRGASTRLQKSDRLPPPERAELLRMIDEEVVRMGDVVQNFLDLSRRQRDGQPEVFALRPVLERTLDILRTELMRSGVEATLHWEAGDDLRVRGRAQAMHHVFLNLGLNARNFMPEGGALNVRVLLRRSEVRILFEDTGPGVPRQIRNRIFDAFFTTRPQGTGLGLAFVDRIVTEHGGSVTVGTASGGGASFEILLPIVTG